MIDPVSYYLGLGFLVGSMVMRVFGTGQGTPPDYLVYEDGWAQPIRMTNAEYQRYKNSNI